MSPRSEILTQQRQWANARSLNPDSRGYLSDVRDNLFQRMSADALRAFELGSGNELSDTVSRPAKMKALHSSSALAVNFFDYFSENGAGILAQALSLPDNVESVEFEAQFQTGLPGNPPNIDVALTLQNGHVLGIESKFTEWLSRKSASKVPFKQKYFNTSSPLWSAATLPSCQSLAESLQERKISYTYLDAAQLLKHVLGMSTALEGSWSLYYFYFDWSGQEATQHRKEIEDFEARVGSETGFRAISYQELIGCLKDELEDDSEHLEYIASRYSTFAA